MTLKRLTDMCRDAERLAQEGLIKRLYDGVYIIPLTPERFKEIEYKEGGFGRGEHHIAFTESYIIETTGDVGEVEGIAIFIIKGREYSLEEEQEIMEDVFYFCLQFTDPETKEEFQKRHRL